MREFVVACCDTAELFDPTEEAFHQIAVLVEMLIVRALDQAVALWWNNSLNAIGRKMFKNGIAIVGLISTE